METADTEKGFTALFMAVIAGHTETVKSLLEQGAEVNRQDNDQKTPLMWAAQYGRKEEVKLLIEKGADVHAKDKRGNTAMAWSKTFRKNMKVRNSIRQMLEKAGAVKEEKK